MMVNFPCTNICLLLYISHKYDTLRVGNGFVEACYKQFGGVELLGLGLSLLNKFELDSIQLELCLTD